jgi:hypothetical protein
MCYDSSCHFYFIIRFDQLINTLFPFMQIQEFIGRCHRWVLHSGAFLADVVFGRCWAEIAKERDRKGDSEAFMLLVSREACVKRISIRHASCAPSSLSAL